jgi:hypothetical protein
MANEHSSPPDGQTFRQAFCAHIKCSDDVFEDKLFWRCLPPLIRPLAVLIELLNPAFFMAEFEVIRAVGEAKVLEDIVAEANKLHDTQHLRVGFLRGTLKVRVSGRRMVKIGTSVWGRARHRR